MDTFLVIASKRDQRRYADREIPEEIQRKILEAGRIAGSAVNKQPRRFVVIDDPDLRAQVAETVFAADNVRGAKFVVAIVVTGSPGFDAGRAAQNMMLAAWNEGVTSCPNGMPDSAATSELLGVGEDEHVINILTFGYPEPPRSPDDRPGDQWLARAKRKFFDEVVERRAP
jgi:nitroreductase